MSRSFASRFASVAALMGMSSAASDDDAPKPGEAPTPNEQDGDDADDAGNDGGESTEGQPAVTPPVEQPAGQPAGAASQPSQAQMIAAFERDANALVAAERDRCIAVFTSPAAASNIAGAAHVLAKTDMDSASAIEFLGTTAAASKSSPRDRLTGSAAARPVTGASTDNAAAAGDPVSQAKARRKARSAAAAKRGEKAVAATDSDPR